MADVIKRLFKGAVPTAATDVYTCTAPVVRTVVRKVTVTNTTGGEVAFTLMLAGEEVVANRTVKPGVPFEWDTGHVIIATEKINLQASATGLKIYITGVEQ